jgi:uncharacterized protein YdhG (YjbR/CyaY superfamily)
MSFSPYNRRMPTVHEFISRRVQPEHREIVQKIRKLMGELAPSATEILTYGILGWKVKRIIAVVSPTRKDITLAFSRGASFEDKYGLLQGAGKVSKNLKFKDAKDVKKTILAYYIKQALRAEAD